MKLSVIAATCLLMLASAVAQEKPHAAKVAAAAPSFEPQVSKFWEAYKTKNKAALGAMLSESHRQVEEGDSKFGDKKSEIASVDDFELMNYTLRDFTAKSLGPQSVLVTYLAQYEGKAGGEVSKSNSAFSQIWVREGSVWKSVYLQETALK
jgi:hypothetical protein